MPQRIAVIGGVASGPAAAAEAKRTDPEAEVVLFEQGPRISYGACEMPYYVADEIKAAETLVVLTPEEFERTRGVPVWVRHRVHAIRPQQRCLDVENLSSGSVREERFDKFILAVGAHARAPDIEGVAAPNVFPLRRLADAIGMKTYLEAHDVRHAVVLGGGYIGAETAEALRTRGLRVTILEPLGGVLPTYLDDELRSLVLEAVKQHGVLVRQEKAMRFELDREGRVSAVFTDRGEKIGCQLVVLAMGVVPNTDLAEAAGVKTGATGALAANDRMRTNLTNVWACGDCVEVERVVDHKKIYLPLSPVAFRTGRVAARNAARQGRGGPARFPGVCPASAVRVFGIEAASVGLKLKEAQEAGFDAFASSIRHWSRVKIYPGSKPLHVRFVVERGRGRLLGAELVGEEGAALRADVLVPLVREGWTVAALWDLDLIYHPPLAPSLDPLLIAAREAMKRLEDRG